MHSSSKAAIGQLGFAQLQDMFALFGTRALMHQAVLQASVWVIEVRLGALLLRRLTLGTVSSVLAASARPVWGRCEGVAGRAAAHPAVAL